MKLPIYISLLLLGMRLTTDPLTYAIYVIAISDLHGKGKKGR
jgi:hypothetical protein